MTRPLHRARAAFLAPLTLVLACAFASFVAACHAEYNLNLLPGTEEHAKDPCSFEVTDKFPPAAEYSEIGRFEVEFYPSHDLASLKEAIKNEVCRVGGDVVVAQFDNGRANTAIMYRKTVAPAPTATPSG
jgi:hypothetical protein